MKRWFDGADADRNGSLDKPEFLADGRRFFAVVDRDRDGRLTDLEIGLYETEIAPEILPRLRQGPGEREGEPSPGRRRSRERGPGLEALSVGQAGPPPGGRPRGGPPGGPGGRPSGGPYRAASGAAPYGLLADPQPVRSADTDFDMKVSGEEWTAALNRRFRLLDRDGDGKLTLAELPKPGGQPGPRRQRSPRR